MNDWTRIRRRWPHAPERAARNGGAGRAQLRLRPEPSTAAAPRRSRPAPLTLLGALLVLLAFVGFVTVLNHAGHRIAVLVAARSLPAGTVLQPADLQTGKVAANAAMLSTLLPGSDSQQTVGRTLRAPVSAGAPLVRSALATTTAQPAQFTLVVPLLHALGGNIEPGERVSVLATYDQAGAGQANTRPIARGLVVISVGRPPAGLDAASATIPVIVALPNPSLAAQLALANSDAKIDLLRDGSRTAAAPIPAATEGPSG